jgi:hypothetical protein
MASPLNYSSFAKPIIVKPLTDIVNLSISTSTFPDRLKEAQVAPIHKKNSVLEKGNYMTLIDHMHLISITASHEGGSQRPLISP